MLYIEANREGTRIVLGWHISEPLPTQKTDEIVSVYADEQELSHIIDNFHNLPFNPHKRANVWHGDFAKFIVANLG